MTILQALNNYYDRMAARGEAEPPDYSREKISYEILLTPDGVVAAVNDIRDTTGKKPFPIMMNVPAGAKKAAGIISNRLWDKAAYVLGVELKANEKTPKRHAEFKNVHAMWLADSHDVGLVALKRFLEKWEPSQFEEDSRFNEEMKEANFVFRLDGEKQFIHDRAAARELVAAGLGSEGNDWCLGDAQH